MATEKGYNGWTNYETWVVKLWMDNDQSSYNYWNETALKCWNASGVKTPNRFVDSHLDNARILLAERLKSEHDELQPEVTGVWADLMNAALSEVNWHEIAESLLDDVEKEETEDA